MTASGTPGAERLFRRLVRVLEDHAAPRLELHLLTLPDRHSTPKLRSFVQFIVAHLGAGSGC